MNRRMTIATGLFAITLTVLSGCGKSDSAGPGISPSPSITAPSAGPKIVGDWHSVAAQWIVHFHGDGTFAEDFQGLTDFRVGTYKDTDTTVTLIGDDGNSDVGTITGDTLVFKLGTLTRLSTSQ